MCVEIFKKIYIWCKIDKHDHMFLVCLFFYKKYSLTKFENILIKNTIPNC